MLRKIEDKIVGAGFKPAPTVSQKTSQAVFRIRGHKAQVEKKGLGNLGVPICSRDRKY